MALELYRSEVIEKHKSFNSYVGRLLSILAEAQCEAEDRPVLMAAIEDIKTMMKLYPDVLAHYAAEGSISTDDFCELYGSFMLGKPVAINKPAMSELAETEDGSKFVIDIYDPGMPSLAIGPSPSHVQAAILANGFRSQTIFSNEVTAETIKAIFNGTLIEPLTFARGGLGKFCYIMHYLSTNRKDRKSIVVSDWEKILGSTGKFRGESQKSPMLSSSNFSSALSTFLKKQDNAKQGILELLCNNAINEKQC